MEENKGWIWDKEKLRLTQDLEWQSGVPISQPWMSKDGKVMIKQCGTFCMFKGLKWDNASGVPSGRCLTEEELKNVPVETLTDNCVTILWKATLIHDICCKYTNEDPTFPFKRKNGDKFFLILSEEANFRYSELYYRFVKLFGKIVLFFKPKK